MSISTDSVTWIPFVTRHYHWLVKPFIAMFDKYAGLPLTFWSDRPIEGIEPHKVEVIFPFDMALYKQPCGTLIKGAFGRVEKPLVGILLMDQLLQAVVDRTKLETLIAFMIDHPVARGNLWDVAEEAGHVSGVVAQDPSAVVKFKTASHPMTDDDFAIVKIPANHPRTLLGCTSLMPALWNRQFLIEFIEDQWTFDAIEQPGQHKFIQWSKSKNWYSVATIPALYRIAHLCFTRDLGLVETGTIQSEDREAIVPFIPKEFRVV